jgi:hypothetical protein
MADEAPDTSPGAWWHKLLAAVGLCLASGIGSALTSHWGGVTSAQLKVVKDDIAAVAAKQQSSDNVEASHHGETKTQLTAMDTKIDKLSAAVLGKKRKVTRAE